MRFWIRDVTVACTWQGPRCATMLREHQVNPCTHQNSDICIPHITHRGTDRHPKYCANGPSDRQPNSATDRHPNDISHFSHTCTHFADRQPNSATDRHPNGITHFSHTITYFTDRCAHKMHPPLCLRLLHLQHQRRRAVTAAVTTLRRSLLRWLFL